MKPDLSKILPKDVPRWITNYLSPQCNKRARQAFQFTINGATYPFVRNFNFAALPDPPLRRRYSMLGALFLARPGDLMFFFQSDPQWRKDDISSRRGLRGIYVVSSLQLSYLDTFSTKKSSQNAYQKTAFPATFFFNKNEAGNHLSASFKKFLGQVN